MYTRFDYILVSHDSGVVGSVTSEWVQDKLRGLRDLGKSVLLITSSHSALQDSSGLKVLKVPSLSWVDFKGDSLGWYSGPSPFTIWSLLRLHPWSIVSSTLGRLFDLAFSLAAGRLSDGKWSWLFTASPLAVYWALRNPGVEILTTGGPSSAHFVGLTAARIARAPLVAEFQDPFIGSEMHLTQRHRRVMRLLESALAKTARRIAMVTQVAAADFVSRNPKGEAEVVCIYPGAWDFKISQGADPIKTPGPLRLTHVGHLYGGRNFDLLIEAIDSLLAAGELRVEDIVLRSQGPAHVPNLSQYRAKGYFLEAPLLSRQAALHEAVAFDVLVLVQHKDSRSRETIPFKTYDYLNLGMPILALVDNPEIEQLIGREANFIGSPTDVGKTLAALRGAVQWRREGLPGSRDDSKKLSSIDQLKQLLN